MAKVAKIADRQNDHLDDNRRRFAQYLALIDKIDDDPKKEDELRAFMRENPDFTTSKSQLAREVKDRLLQKTVAGKGHQLIIEAEMREMGKELAGGEKPLIAERLLIEAVLMCWLRLQYAEYYAAGCMGPGHTFRESEFADKMLTRAYARYIKALTHLARVQALTKPKRESGLEKSLPAVRLLKSTEAG